MDTDITLSVVTESYSLSIPLLNSILVNYIGTGTRKVNLVPGIESGLFFKCQVWCVGY